MNRSSKASPTLAVVSVFVSTVFFTAAVAAFTDGAEAGVTVNAAYIKTKLVNVLTSRVRNYDVKKQPVTYTSFSPS